MATKRHLVIDQGSDFVYQFEVEDDNGAPANLASWTGISLMKRHFDSANSHAFTVTTSEDGLVTLTLDATASQAMNSGRYVYDVLLQLIEESEVLESMRVIEGMVTINPAVALAE